MGLYVADWIIFALMICGTLAIGVYHAFAGRHKQTTSEYLVGNRKLSTFSVAISLDATFFSAILIQGVPAENYMYGGIFWFLMFGHVVGAILSVLIFVPVFHPLELTSVNEYLKMRYDSRFVAILGTLSGITTMCLYTAVIFFAPATAIDLVAGFPTWASILVGTVIAIVYTSLGGIKGVIWTDVFQAVLMIIGLITITIRATGAVGGISNVWEECAKWGRLNFDSINPDPRTRLTLWSVIIGYGWLSLIRYGTTQPAVQRYCGVPTLTKAKLSVLGIIPWSVLTMTLASVTGLTVFAFYSNLGCDPLKGRLIKNPNQLISRFVLDTLNYPGVHGILLASTVAATLSSASSNLNSGSAIIWRDILRVIWPNLPEKRNVMATKCLVVAVGVVSMALGFAASQIGGTATQMAATFIAACGAPTMIMFLLGVFLPFTNWIGAAAAGFIGFCYSMWMSFGGYTINVNTRLPTNIANCSQYAAEYLSIVQATTTTTTTFPTTAIMGAIEEASEADANLRRFYSVSYLWIALFTSLVGAVAGIIVSLLTGGLRNKVPRQLLHPWIRRFCGRWIAVEDQLVVKETTSYGIGMDNFTDQLALSPYSYSYSYSPYQDKENPILVTKC